MRVLTVVGARPQFIKAAPVSRALRRDHTEILVHTGQHYDADMSDIFFEELGIPRPDVNLGIGGLSNVEQVGQMLLALRPLVEAERPDWLLVYGDTNSTLAGALAGRLLDVPVAHVEAGLRSYNRAMPEEHNRVVTDHVATVLFCPTRTARDNLARENVTAGVHIVGDVMADALLQNRARARTVSLDALGLAPGGYLLATIHRAGNTDDPGRLKGILDAFARLDWPIVLPAHPRLRKVLDAVTVPANVHLIPPVGYLDMIGLTANARLVLTDSGGLQKEAYILGIPCITLRDETEWVETVAAGWNRIAGTDAGTILTHAQAALSSVPPDHPDLYGDGRASDRIVSVLASS